MMDTCSFKLSLECLPESPVGISDIPKPEVKHRELPPTGPFSSLFRPLLILFFVFTTLKTAVVLYKTSSPGLYLVIVPLWIVVGFLNFYFHEWRVRHEYFSDGGLHFFWHAVRRYFTTVFFGHMGYALCAVDLAITADGLTYLEQHPEKQQMSSPIVLLCFVNLIPQFITHIYLLLKGYKQRKTQYSTFFMADWIHNYKTVGLTLFCINWALNILDLTLGFATYVRFNQPDSTRLLIVRFIFLTVSLVKYSFIVCYPVLMAWQLQKACLAGSLGGRCNLYRVLCVPLQLRMSAIPCVFVDLTFMCMILWQKTYHDGPLFLSHLCVSSLLLLIGLVVLCLNVEGTIRDIVSVMNVIHTTKDPYLLKKKLKSALNTIENALLPTILTMNTKCLKLIQVAWNDSSTQPKLKAGLIQMWMNFRTLFVRSIDCINAWNTQPVNQRALNEIEHQLRTILSDQQRLEETLVRLFPSLEPLAREKTPFPNMDDISTDTTPKKVTFKDGDVDIFSSPNSCFGSPHPLLKQVTIADMKLDDYDQAVVSLGFTDYEKQTDDDNTEHPHDSIDKTCYSSAEDIDLSMPDDQDGYNSSHMVIINENDCDRTLDYTSDELYHHCYRHTATVKIEKPDNNRKQNNKDESGVAAVEEYGYCSTLGDVAFVDASPKSEPETEHKVTVLRTSDRENESTSPADDTQGHSDDSLNSSNRTLYY